MADEDEIDVLGDFNLDILSKSDTNIFDNTPLVSQNSDLLNCDYTIHPQWLLDRPSTNPALWYNNSSLDISKQFEYATSSSDSQIPASNSITDESGWTEKEKNLLNRGIEIFGKSNVNLSQFIGSRTPSEVRYFLNNFYSDVQLSHTSLNTDLEFDNCVEETVVSSNCVEQVNEILDDNQIPASIEEVIAAVSTAKPTLFTGKKRNSLKKSPERQLTYKEVPSGQSLLKSNCVSKENYSKSFNDESAKLKSKKSVKFKFKTKIKVSPQKSVAPKRNYIKKQTAPRRRPTKSEIEMSSSDAGDVQIITGNGLAVPVSEGEEVIKIRKENETEDSDSEIEIDVEDINDDTAKSTVSFAIIEDQQKLSQKCQELENKLQTIKNEENDLPDKELEKTDGIDSSSKQQVKKIPQLCELEEETVKLLMSTEYPLNEISLENNAISAVEKFIFYEYFEGRPTKTPMRYLRIRNHIINTWISSKPNYVTKTSIRHGLRQCGDVNYIGRIHNYLEQIGAINFGCEQTSYSRPLYDLFAVSAPKEKAPQVTPAPSHKIDLLPRQRNKKKYINDGEGGCTLTHDEKGVIIHTTVVNEEPPPKQRTYIKKPTIRLIYCRPFNETKPQEYSIKVELSALILMDLHAHMYLTEVMGLIGGYWNSLDKQLYITKYVPCKNIAPSTTHCDMCPITQARAAEILHGDNLDILGWYHSHPTFAPEPSQQDIDTQVSVQQWIGTNTPCIGFILSPFSLHGALIASPFRCLIVDKKENFEDQLVPYKFKVELITEGMNVSTLLKEAKRVMHYESNTTTKSRVDFRKPYFQDNSITYLDKYVYSVKMHLAKCSDLNKMTCDAIIDGLSDICNNFTEY